jgi:hypothetical protein
MRIDARRRVGSEGDFVIFDVNSKPVRTSCFIGDVSADVPERDRSWASWARRADCSYRHGCRSDWMGLRDFRGEHIGSSAAHCGRQQSMIVNKVQMHMHAHLILNIPHKKRGSYTTAMQHGRRANLLLSERESSTFSKGKILPEPIKVEPNIHVKVE